MIYHKGMDLLLHMYAFWVKKYKGNLSMVGQQNIQNPDREEYKNVCGRHDSQNQGHKRSCF